MKGLNTFLSVELQKDPKWKENAIKHDMSNNIELVR